MRVYAHMHGVEAACVPRTLVRRHSIVLDIETYLVF